MSTSFNPALPSDQDSVYDAYLGFRKNMIAINNLLDIDHYNGTAQNYRGMHKWVTIPERLAQAPSVQGSGAVIFATTLGNETRLKYVTSQGVKDIITEVPTSLDTKYLSDASQQDLASKGQQTRSSIKIHTPTDYIYFLWFNVYVPGNDTVEISMRTNDSGYNDRLDSYISASLVETDIVDGKQQFYKRNISNYLTLFSFNTSSDTASISNTSKNPRGATLHVVGTKRK